MGEFIILREESRIEFANKLNQWRNDFDLKLHKIHFDCVGDFTTIYAVIERTKKNDI